jgi:Bacterial regulatory proteins, gntR family
VYRALARGASTATERQRHPLVTRGHRELAAVVGCSVPTVKRALAALERAGWLKRARQTQAGRRGGRLRGRCRFELIMPADVAAGLLFRSSQRGITNDRQRS